MKILKGCQSNPPNQENDVTCVSVSNILLVGKVGDHFSGTGGSGTNNFSSD